MNSYNKIVVLGAGESGNGAAILAKRQGYDVFVSDFGAIKSTYKSELEAYDIPFEEGGHTESIIFNADLIIKSPGIPEAAPIMVALRKTAVEIISEIEWAFRFKGTSKIVGITGTNGKSTTTSLTYDLFKKAGFNTSIVGNIGISFAKQVALEPTDWYIIEISSFQLDDINSFRADIAMILNITPDHLDRYHYDFNEYVDSKFRIAKYQTPKDILIVNQDDEAIMNYLEHHNIESQLIPMSMNNVISNKHNAAYLNDNFLHILFGDDDFTISANDLALRGKHNQYNTMAAGISGRAANIRKEAIRDCFTTFQGLEHRLEYVATINGVRYINDSKGTNLNSVWYALESMKVPVVLILGGKDKGNDYNEIMELVKEKVKAIVCMGKDNTPIHKVFDSVVDTIVDTDSAAEAVAACMEIAQSGDVVLLSPGCASFDLFSNYEDRGQKFKEAVKAYLK